MVSPHSSKTLARHKALLNQAVGKAGAAHPFWLPLLFQLQSISAEHRDQISFIT